MRIAGVNIKEVYVRWIGIFILAYIMTFIHNPEPGQSRIEKYLIALVFTTVFWNGAFKIFMYFRGVFPQIRQTPKRLLITFIALAGFLVVADPLLCLIFGFNEPEEYLSAAYYIEHVPINIVIAIIVGSVYENVYFFEQWRNSIQLNEELKNQQIRTQFEVLQNQMSPHFLFNSLNTLTTLIAEDQTLAINFTEKLSEVYRYILQNKERQLVTLSEEVQFAKSYGYLLQLRYPENLQIHFDIPDEFQHQSIAPLTLQMLVENAIKHNVSNKSNPLTIEVLIEKGEAIIVRNNLKLKKSMERSTKTGLTNIHSRYSYFTDKPVDIRITETHYEVAVPLLEVVNEREALLA